MYKNPHAFLTIVFEALKSIFSVFPLNLIVTLPLVSNGKTLILTVAFSFILAITSTSIEAPVGVLFSIIVSLFAVIAAFS